MSYSEKALQILQSTGLKPKHFADLIRAAQLVADPGAGVSGRKVGVDWSSFGVPLEVVANLLALGEKYRYASPYLPVEEVWEQLAPHTRTWFMENRDTVWQFEEYFPPLDED